MFTAAFGDGIDPLGVVHEIKPCKGFTHQVGVSSGHAQQHYLSVCENARMYFGYSGALYRDDRYMYGQAIFATSERDGRPGQVSFLRKGYADPRRTLC